MKVGNREERTDITKFICTWGLEPLDEIDPSKVLDLAYNLSSSPSQSGGSYKSQLGSRKYCGSRTTINPFCIGANPAGTFSIVALGCCPCLLCTIFSHQLLP